MKRLLLLLPIFILGCKQESKITLHIETEENSGFELLRFTSSKDTLEAHLTQEKQSFKFDMLVDNEDELHLFALKKGTPMVSSTYYIESGYYIDLEIIGDSVYLNYGY